MLIINKKKIMFIICAVFFSFAIFGFTNKDEINIMKNRDNMATILVNTVPITNKTIIR